MSYLVMKFGGTSVASVERLQRVAQHVKREVNAGRRVIAVVSAMSGTTDSLVELCASCAKDADKAEYDVVVSSGEQITAGLLAILLNAIGVPARSWQGWQVPLYTDDKHANARVTGGDKTNFLSSFSQYAVAVTCGFQGLNLPSGRVTTLGRGGSDTSAVALAALVGAERCDIYTDVDGVYTTDPRLVPNARRLDAVSFEEMLEMTSLGAKVLHVRSVELAMLHAVRLCVRSSFDDPALTGEKGTLICREEDILEKQTVTSITFTKNEARISLRGLPERPGIAAEVFEPLAKEGVIVDMIVQNASEDGEFSNITFSVNAADYDRAVTVLKKAQKNILYKEIQGQKDVAKISAIGVGMKSHAGVAAKAFRALAEHGINIRAITTSEIKFSVLIDAEYTELAVHTLHHLYGLDA